MSPSQNSIFMFISHFHSHPGLQGRGRIKGPVRQNVMWEELFGINRQTKNCSENCRGKKKDAHYPPDTKMYVFPVCAPAWSSGTCRPSAESDTVFLLSCREKAVIWKLHRKWHLIDGNEKILWNNTQRATPWVMALGVICIPNTGLAGIFQQLFLTMS